MTGNHKPGRAVGPSLEAALNASGFVGTWENDLLKNVVRLSGPVIDLLGISPDRAAIGVPLAQFLAGIHRDDQETIAELVHEAHETAGRFEAQFRTVRTNGDVRWVAARGEVETDAQGRGIRCLGVVVDITDTRPVENTVKEDQLAVVHKLVDVLLSLRAPIMEFGPPTLKSLVDLLLIELGRELAKLEPKIDHHNMH